MENTNFDRETLGFVTWEIIMLSRIQNFNTCKVWFLVWSTTKFKTHEKTFMQKYFCLKCLLVLFRKLDFLLWF